VDVLVTPLSLANPTLNVGQAYWFSLSIPNIPSYQNTRIMVLLNRFGDISSPAAISNDGFGINWDPPTNAGALRAGFSVQGITVPEPSSLGLVALVLATLAPLRPRRR